MDLFASSPVIAEPDVCVVGGGAAGVSAAVACGRLGLKTLLLEKYGFCGGATVAGLSGTICGLYGSGKKPEQIVFGFAGEFHDKLRAAGGAHPAIPFGHTKLVRKQARMELVGGPRPNGFDFAHEIPSSKS